MESEWELFGRLIKMEYYTVKRELTLLMHLNMYIITIYGKGKQDMIAIAAIRRNFMPGNVCLHIMFVGSIFWFVCFGHVVCVMGGSVCLKGEKVNILQGCLPLKVNIPAQKLPSLIF